MGQVEEGEKAKTTYFTCKGMSYTRTTKNAIWSLNRWIWEHECERSRFNLEVTRDFGDGSGVLVICRDRFLNLYKYTFIKFKTLSYMIGRRGKVI